MFTKTFSGKAGIETVALPILIGGKTTSPLNYLRGTTVSTLVAQPGVRPSPVAELLQLVTVTSNGLLN